MARTPSASPKIDSSTGTVKIFLCVTIAGLLALQAQAQLIRGRVVDGDADAALPAATVQVEGTYRGTITNGEGFFDLQLDEFPAVLVFRYIGYETRRIEIAKPPAGIYVVELNPIAYEMPEVVVTGEDPAIGIMREVIERKKVWRAALETYEVTAYSRYTVYNDTGIVAVRESVTSAYWDRERGMKELLKGTRKSAGLDLGANIPAAGTVVNLYDDNISVAGHTLIGVTHPDALSRYRFRLEGTRRLDNEIVYDIAVEPRITVSGFEGVVAVHGGDYALLEAELRPGAAFLFPYPIQSVDIAYRQQFSSFGGQFWLPVDFHFEGSAEASISVLLRLPPITFVQVSRFSDYQVNAAVPEDLFDEPEYMRVDSVAVAADSILAWEGVAVPLLPEEELAYARTDTISFERAFELKGPAARLIKLGMREAAMAADSADSSWLHDLDLLPDVRYNRVDALHAGLRTAANVGDRLRIRGGAGWSSGLAGAERWAYHAGGRLSIGEPGSLRLEGTYRAGTARRYESEHIGQLLSGLAMLVGAEDYFDYYRSEGYRIRADLSARGGKLEVSAIFRSEYHSPLRRTTSFDIWGRHRAQRENVSIVPGMLQAVEVSLAVGRGSDFEAAIAGRNRLEIAAERSIGGSDYDYARYSLAADWTRETMGRRRLLPGKLHLRMEAGTSTGVLPLQRTFLVEGGVMGYRPFGTLRSLPGLPYEGDDIVAFYWEHNFRTMPFELIGLGTLVRRGYSMLVFGGHARTWTPISRNGTNGHHELGLSLSGILGVLRVDVAKHLGGHFAVSVGIARIL